MTETPSRLFPARAVIVVLGLGLAVMLAASLKERFENPHLSVAVEPRPVMSDAAGADAQSIGALMRKVAANPQDVDALVHLVEHLVAAQNWQAAETFAQRAVALDSANPAPLYLLGVILHNQERHKEAAEVLEGVLKRKDEASVRYSLGVLYAYFLQDPAKGREHLAVGLADPAGSEELKASIRQELEKIPPPAPAVPADPPKEAAPSGKEGEKKAKKPSGSSRERR